MRSRGFTLVEVLVAMVIMAIMAVMAWQGVDGIVRTRNASQARLETTLRLNTVIAQWDQDLASIQETGVVSPALACDGAVVRGVGARVVARRSGRVCVMASGVAPFRLFRDGR